MNGDGGRRLRGSEVCRIVDVPPYVLRVWEREFPTLATMRAASGPSYSEEEVALIREIRRLLYEEQYTIAGAKKRIEAERAREAGRPAPADVPAPGEDVELEAAPVDEAEPEPGQQTLLPLVEPEREVVAPRVRRPRGRPVPAEGPPPERHAEAGLVDPPPTPVVQPPDPRVARAIAELREILELLKRDTA